jgi:ribosomal-protein-alanine N-acetyltransferase
MNAAAADTVQRPLMRPMRVEDLESVMDVERRAYPYPWSIGIFRDCLFAGYPAWVLLEGGSFIGHGVLSVAADEAHLLNVCVDPARQGRGYGRALLRAMVAAARGKGARRVFLEVRPSNPAAVALYQDEGFNEIGRRPRYYPADTGREDAIVMAMELFDDA